METGILFLFSRSTNCVTYSIDPADRIFLHCRRRSAAIHVYIPVSRGTSSLAVVFAANYVAALIYTASCIQSPWNVSSPAGQLPHYRSQFHRFVDVDRRQSSGGMNNTIGDFAANISHINGNPYTRLDTNWRKGVYIRGLAVFSPCNALMAIPIANRYQYLFAHTPSYHLRAKVTANIFSDGYINITSSIILDPNSNTPNRQAAGQNIARYWGHIQESKPYTLRY